MGEWISVKDRLPESCKRVLCAGLVPERGKGRVELRLSGFYRASEAWGCEDMIVTHWMPLPELPQEG